MISCQRVALRFMHILTNLLLTLCLSSPSLRKIYQRIIYWSARDSLLIYWCVLIQATKKCLEFACLNADMAILYTVWNEGILKIYSTEPILNISTYTKHHIFCNCFLIGGTHFIKPFIGFCTIIVLVIVLVSDAFNTSAYLKLDII